MRRRRPSDETLVTLRGKLDDLPPRSAERQQFLQGCADLHGVSVATIYRALREQFRPRSLHRRDRGRPRKLSQREMERFCELIAAMKLRTTNQKNRHLSTNRALELLVEHGIETPDGLVRAPLGLLTRATVNRYLRIWGLDDERMGRPPPAQRFQAEHANECWQFDLSPSDLKHVPAPLWVEAGRGAPTLMLFSAVDDRSGVAYQEYRCVYGEDVAAALRFLFNAMSPKDEPGLVLQGIPGMLYLDNGPVAKSGTFRRVMAQLGVDVRTHMPRGSDGRRVTARSKGKVERPFRTVKEAHETLYHFHTPQNEAEANLWLRNYLVRYNAQPHRLEPRSRAEDWSSSLPEVGIRAMCAWDRFRTFAREPERRHVGVDARVQVDGVAYEVDPSLAGETVTLWWGLFDHELFVEHEDQRFGPFGPIDGPIPLHRYRSFRKTTADERLGRIEVLASKLGLPRAALDGPVPVAIPPLAMPATVPFNDPDLFRELRFPNVLAAKLAV
ncbi:MAG: IS481 family transposase, partial [Pseudomonadota bacterium]|nr:IS481 family transposase [Pseudomonadota bacterium]